MGVYEIYLGKKQKFLTVVSNLETGEPLWFGRERKKETLDEFFEKHVRGYVGKGAFTNDSLNTFGGAGVVEIPRMQKLLRYICENGFEHHVAANFSTVAAATHEAATRYLGWATYRHGRDGSGC